MSTEKQKIAARKYYAKHKEKVLDKKKSYYTENAERIKAYSHEYGSNNPEKWEQWYEAKKNNPEFKEKRAANLKAWNEANKDSPTYKAKRNSDNKRYQQSKQDNNYIITELDKFVEKEMYELATLRTKQTGQAWHVDHIQPLSKGGRHEVKNLQVVPAVWNLKKGNRNSNVYREVTA